MNVWASKGGLIRGILRYFWNFVNTSMTIFLYRKVVQKCTLTLIHYATLSTCTVFRATLCSLLVFRPARTMTGSLRVRKFLCNSVILTLAADNCTKLVTKEDLAQNPIVLICSAHSSTETNPQGFFDRTLLWLPGTLTSKQISVTFSCLWLVTKRSVQCIACA